MVLPADTAPPAAYFTRAISIDAPPSAVWPWLLAVGQDPAGFLSNDYLENLAGGDIHNADTLRPEWVERSLGDKVPMSGPAEPPTGRRLHTADRAHSRARARHRRHRWPLRPAAPG
jgi:hypothetical protein